MVLKTMLDFWYRNQSTPVALGTGLSRGPALPTLLAGFVLSFSKIFCDWAFVANAIMTLRCGTRNSIGPEAARCVKACDIRLKH